MNDSAFGQWYDSVFGNVLGAEDDSNRDAVRKIWNAVIEHVAKQVEFDNYELVPSELVASRIRNLKESK